MAKKPKNESIQDILDRIQEDIDNIREKAEELENHDCSDSDDDFEDDEE
jgi:HEPN domain-containing protein